MGLCGGWGSVTHGGGGRPLLMQWEGSGMDRVMKILTWPAALFVAGVLLWYEQFKLSGNAGSVELFTTLTDWLGLHGYEAWMRLGVAWAEIAASVLVINQPSRMWGAAGALGLMSGAIFFHVASPLGVDPYGDGGVLFKEACGVWLCSAFILVAYRVEGIALLRRVMGGR